MADVPVMRDTLSTETWQPGDRLRIKDDTLIPIDKDSLVHVVIAGNVTMVSIRCRPNVGYFPEGVVRTEEEPTCLQCVGRKY